MCIRVFETQNTIEDTANETPKKVEKGFEDSKRIIVRVLQQGPPKD